MRKNLSTTVLFASCFATLGAAGVSGGEDNGQVRTPPLSMVTQLDAGQITQGHIDNKEIDEIPGNNSFMQRISVWVTQEMMIGERLNVKAGVGGLFWFSVPSGQPGGAEAAAVSVFQKFGPGISRADMTYRFGSLDRPMFTLQAGLFPYKYNPDAKNLGEYLLRSGTYPGYLTTGGWNILGEAGYMLQGIRLNMSLWGGRFQSEFLLPMERDIPPMADLSPTYIASLAAAPGVEIGAGVTCNHCISVKPSQTSPRVKYDPNASDGDPGTGYVIPNPAFDPNSPVTELSGSNPRYKYDTTRFYTFQGVKLMGRISLDPKAYLPMPFLGAQDLKIFAEVAVLGVKNYPFYYEKIEERMPVMFGMNLPTFKLLDALSFQMEYYNSPFPNTMENIFRFQSPTTSFVDSTGLTKADPNLFYRNSPVVTEDNWKWSLYAKKELIKGLRFYALAAKDHLRLPDYQVTGPRFTYYRPVTNNQGDWYYLIRLELGI